MGFSLRQIRCFVTIAELGQVSRAAEQLNVTQSAVTIALRELEHELGYRLFNRAAHGMQLTEDGRHFLAHAHTIEAAVADAHGMPRLGEVDAELLLAATPTLVGYFLPEHVHRLAGLHPALRIAMRELDRRSIEAGLLDGTFDIGVLVTSNVSDPALETLTLVHSPRRLWVSAGHRLAGQAQVSLADVAREPLMQLTADEAAQAAERYWSQYGQQPQIRLRSSSIEAIRSMVGNGMGVTIASDLQYRPWSLEGKRIETVLLHEAIPPLSVGLAWRAGGSFSPAQTIVRHYFRQRFLESPNRYRLAR